jgi:hypothetical protein
MDRLGLILSLIADAGHTESVIKVASLHRELGTDDRILTVLRHKGISPLYLHNAIIQKDENCAFYLLSLGVLWDVPDPNHGMTPLMLSWRTPRIQDKLLRLGASVTLQDKGRLRIRPGKTALQHALTVHSHMTQTKIISMFGCSNVYYVIKHIHRHSIEPLIDSAHAYHYLGCDRLESHLLEDRIKALIQAGSSVTALSQSRFTALQLSIRSNTYFLLPILLEAGVPITKKDLEYACILHKYDYLIRMLRYKYPTTNNEAMLCAIEFAKKYNPMGRAEISKFMTKVIALLNLE